jgi:hypothetical protein
MNGRLWKDGSLSIGLLDGLSDDLSDDLSDGLSATRPARPQTNHSLWKNVFQQLFNAYILMNGSVFVSSNKHLFEVS